MTFSQSITACMGKYGTFAGRASKSEFWWFVLFGVLMQWGATLVDASYYDNWHDDPGFTSALVTIVFLVPTLAAGCRRLHDTGRSGWWQLLILTGIGIVLLAFWYAGKPKAAGNRFKK